MKKLILSSEGYMKKLALIENNKISEILFEKKSENEISGNFYKGRVVDIINGMESIFVDIGLEKNAFLNISKFKNKKKFSKGEDILVQVEANPRDEKGAKLTLDYSISSKNLVLLPNSKQVSLSSKIRDKIERKYLEQIFYDVEDIGLVVRTAAVSSKEEELRKEYEDLILKWRKIEKLFKEAKTKKLLYSQNSIIEKLFRDFFDANTDELIIDNEVIFEEVIKYIEENELDNLKIKVKKYFKEEDIFEHYGINIELENALNRKVWLNSGGYLVIEKTEALVSIDVNTGRNIENKNLEETIVKTNLEAAIEIVRQLRLRNLSGLIIIDFIDMKKNSNKKLILKTLENELKNDRMKTEIVNYSSLNLMQLTRQRQGQELSYYFRMPCSYCEGTGLMKSEEAIILDILKEIKEISKDDDIKKVEIISGKEIIKKIKLEIIEYIEGVLKKKKIICRLVEKDGIRNNFEISLFK
ncbi:Rne/Rng family ribonuclease [Fusobacterium russii]|uniref:Rne/Rng family ribonuclease n=1 Tax=Fusobacterium russii TaxID=854 RepID=UPI0003A8663B|nr:Rne/Rng family ribonuclease [Fusobacterium russii]